MTQNLTPPNATDLEQSLDEAAGTRFDGVQFPNRSLGDPMTCPASHLPWLAWAYSVDLWDSKWPEETKREVIASSISVHRRKGTVRSVKEALEAAGFGGARIIENLSANAHDGTLAHDAAETYRRSGHWAEYRIELTRPISIKQAEDVRRILELTAPKRCRLIALDFSEADSLYNDTIRNDGQFTHGVV